MTDNTVLRPPGQPYDKAAETPHSHRWLWTTLGLLVLLALAVIFALPRALAPGHQVAEAPSKPPASSGTDSETDRKTAHQTLQHYLQLRARLELESAGAWGEPRWSEATAHASAGDHHFAQREFRAAAGDYRAALDLLQRLAGSRGEMLARALEEGAAALEEDDVETAVARFEAALVIAPDDPDATRGLTRAASRAASIAQLKQGATAESGGDLDAAQSAYLRATQLDGSYAEAAAALQRVNEQISGRDFTAAMSRGLAALDGGQTTQAAAAFAEAERLRPGDTAVRDARQRLQLMRTQAALSGLRRRAAEETRSEDWQSAAAIYRKALAMDPAAGFARTGLPHAEARLKLHAQLDHYLDDPARLYSEKPLANARQLLSVNPDAPADEPRLARKIGDLRDRVAEATRPVTVTLQSDGQTDVVIYRVGRLGQFDSHQLDLLPGDYTVVGSRPGYRDVRKVIRLRPGVPAPPLVVRCEEAI